MNKDTEQMKLRLEELQADHAVAALTVEEEAELRVLLAELPGSDPDAFDRAAAAFDLALRSAAVEPMPVALAERVRADARAHFAGGGQEAGGVLAFPERPAARTALLPWAGLVAAAAVILVLLFIRPATGPGDPIVLRDELMASAGDLIRMEWANPTDDPAGAGMTGDVVWSPSRQEGYMRFRGLEPNDPSANQYQLWIFDGTRKEAHPVDGGVFDIPAGAGEVIVPIHAKLPVRDMSMMAVTIEPPGGVVVSDRERIPALALPAD